MLESILALIVIGIIITLFFKILAYPVILNMEFTQKYGHNAVSYLGTIVQLISIVVLLEGYGSKQNDSYWWIKVIIGYLIFPLVCYLAYVMAKSNGADKKDAIRALIGQLVSPLTLVGFIITIKNIMYWFEREE